MRDDEAKKFQNGSPEEGWLKQSIPEGATNPFWVWLDTRQLERWFKFHGVFVGVRNAASPGQSCLGKEVKDEFSSDQQLGKDMVGQQAKHPYVWQQ